MNAGQISPWPQRWSMIQIPFALTSWPGCLIESEKQDKSYSRLIAHDVAAVLERLEGLAWRKAADRIVRLHHRIKRSNYRFGQE